MGRTRKQYLLEKRVIHLLEEENERLYMTPEKYKTYLKYVSYDGKLLKKMFQGKDLIIDGDLNLSNMNIKSLGPVSYIDGRLILKNTNIDEINDVNFFVSDGILGNDYILLHNYVRTGKVDYLKSLYNNNNFVYDYEISDDRLNTEIFLKFDDDEDFFNMCGLDDDSIWFISSVRSDYSGYEYFDMDRAESDFYEGYAYSYFDEDNIATLIDILKLVAPELNINDKKDLEENSQQVYDKLDMLFPKEFEEIISEYYYTLERAIKEAVNKDIEEEFTDVFSDFGLDEVRLFYEYKIEVGELLSLFEEFGKNSTIFDLFKKISDEKLSFPYFMDFQYQSDFSSELDDSSLNRDIFYQLEKMQNKMEESGIENFEEYKKIVDELKKKFNFNQLYVLPKDYEKNEFEKRYFKILSVDFTTNKIKFNLLNPGGKGGDREMNLEDFNLFLYHPELFDDRIK